MGSQRDATKRPAIGCPTFRVLTFRRYLPAILRPPTPTPGAPCRAVFRTPAASASGEGGGFRLIHSAQAGATAGGLQAASEPAHSQVRTADCAPEGAVMVGEDDDVLARRPPASAQRGWSGTFLFPRRSLRQRRQRLAERKRVDAPHSSPREGGFLQTASVDVA